MNQNLSLRNSAFWNQLCGSRAAHKLGIVAGEPDGVKVFDDWFFDFYPYLRSEKYIPWESLSDKRVLEIGLGYGSISRRLSRRCQELVSLDVARGAVEFVRLTTEGVQPLQASALNLPIADNSMDCVISLGCLHHTGDLSAALQECLRVLRPGGKLVVMVYNRYSYKRWIVAPIATYRASLVERRNGQIQSGVSAPPRVRRFWDRSPSGIAPPHTEFASKKQLNELLVDVNTLEIDTINLDNLTDLLPLGMQKVGLDRLRIRLLDSWMSRHLGLDLYLTAIK